MGLPYFVRAHLYVGGAHIHERALRGRAVRRTSPSPFWANQRRCLWNRSSRTGLLRGERSYADGVPVQSAVSAHAGMLYGVQPSQNRQLRSVFIISLRTAGMLS